MAVRRRAVRPDAVLDTQTHGQIPYVTDETYLEALIAAGQVQAFAGGVLTVLVRRHPTDTDGEMITTAAVIEWKDRTDAKAQPEPSTGEVLPAIPQPGLFEPTGEGDDLPPEAEVLDAEPPAVEEPEEDVSEIPAHMR